jgi:hypothetical protein
MRQDLLLPIVGRRVLEAVIPLSMLRTSLLSLLLLACSHTEAIAPDDGSGAATGSAGDSGGLAGAAGGSGSAAGGAAGVAGSVASGSLDCNPQHVTCKMLPSACPALQVHEVVAGCWGDCGPAERCGCTSATDCPDETQFTCMVSQQHCTPYLR